MNKFEEVYEELLGFYYWSEGVTNSFKRLKEAHESDADDIIAELCKALEITMQAYHDTHPKYIMAENALKKARGEK
jgi:hypothetical protein